MPDTFDLAGICLNWGGIATIALLRLVEKFHLMPHAGNYSFAAEKILFDAACSVDQKFRLMMVV
jgi:pyruvate/2-oxoglutarate dehydrogenase complex dihydrolipoamide dehydrogenase (E3) component